MSAADGLARYRAVVHAYEIAMALVREAVRCHRAQMAAHGKSAEWHAAHPEHDHPEALDLSRWYKDACDVVDALDGGG